MMRIIGDEEYTRWRYRQGPSAPSIEQKFLSQCQRLRNNATGRYNVVKKVDAKRAIRGYGYLLGGAMLQNSTVEHISLCMSVFFPDGGFEPADEAAPMLKYIRESEALQTVALVGHLGHQDDFNLSGQILIAIAGNQHVNSVRIDTKPRVQDFVCLLSSAPHLSSLDIGSMTFESFFDGGVSSADSHAIVDALASNTSLEKMSLDFDRTPNHWVELVLRRLRAHCRLRHLEICNGHEGTRQPAVVILQNLFSLPALLKLLLLDKVELDLAASELLRDGFRSNRTCRVLSLRDCKFTAEATDSMITFFQLEANRNLSVLEEVNILVRESVTYRDMRTFLEREVRHVIPAMLRGAALKKFKLKVGWDGLIAGVEGLFRELSESATEIRVPHLEFQYRPLVAAHEATTLALCEFLRATATLQELRVSASDDWPNGSRIVSAMRQNGSLRRAEFLRYHPDDDIDADFNPYEYDYGDDFEQSSSIFDVLDGEDEDQQLIQRARARRVETYLKRNATLPEMVVAPVLSDNVANGAISGPNIAGELLAVALHAPGTAPNTLFRSMIAPWVKDVRLNE